MRLCALCVATLAIVAALHFAEPTFFTVEVRVRGAGGESVKYLLLEWRGGASLSLPVPSDAREVLVRVDSATPFKPCAVAIGGRNVTPSYEEGVTLVEDFAWLNLTRMRQRPESVTVFFERGEARPPVYGIGSRGDGIWGHLVEALLPNLSALKDLGVKATIILKRRVPLPSLLSNSSAWDVLILQTGRGLERLLARLSNSSLQLTVVPLYYSPDPAQGNLYVYFNAPAAWGPPGGRVVADDILGRVFPGNPALLKAANPQLGAPACPLTVVNKCPLDYVVGGTLVRAWSSVRMERDCTSPLSAEAYLRGSKVYALTIFGFPERLELPCLAYDVDVVVLDSRGEPAANVTLILSGVGSPLRQYCFAAEGSCTFENIPPGDYVVSAYVGVKEVGRELLRVERGPVQVTITAALQSFCVSVLRPTGEKLSGYELRLQGGGIERKAVERGGRACLSGVPTGLYNYTVYKGGTALAAGTMNVEVGRSTYVVVANVSRVYLKVVDVVGRPIPYAEVEFAGPANASVVTDGSGSAALDLPIGTYEVRVRGTGLRKLVEVRSGGEYVTLVLPPSPMLPAAVLALLLAGLIAAVGVRLAKSRGSVEVIDVEEQ